MKKFFYLVCLCGILSGLNSCSEYNGAADEITIYGNVIDRVTGQPLYNVLIKEKNQVGGSTVTGNDGNYEFTLPLNGRSEGQYYLVASKDKYSSSEYVLNMAQVDKSRLVKVDFQLQRNAIIYTGKVVDQNNNPVYDARIDYYRGTNGVSLFTTTFTNEEGIYQFELDDFYTKNWDFQIKLVASKKNYLDDVFEGVQRPEQIGQSVTINFLLNIQQ